MKNGKHFVAIIGGGVAGAEAAYQLSQRQIPCVLFEQKALPYGKIEEGLPKWHIKLRNQEELKIDTKIMSPLVQFVPNTRLGRDISIEDLLSWGFSAILLAIGAWRDRRLPLPEIDDYVGRGFYYQNQFVSWFNHKHEPNGEQPHCEIKDNAIVIGGGLASLDVAKILMIEMVLERLERRGYKADLFTLEKEGIAATLGTLCISLADLHLAGCTIYYRKRVVDMPLTTMPKDKKSVKIREIYELRKRILQNFQDKYLFKVVECFSPVDKMLEDDHVAGIIFERQIYNRGSWKPDPGSQRISVRSPLVISSIGSIPEIPAGFPKQGEFLSIQNEKLGQVSGWENVFALGNVVTGRGNIRESLRSSRKISRQLMDNFLAGSDKEIKRLIQQRESDTTARIARVEKKLKSKPGLSTEKIDDLKKKIRYAQQKVGYSGDYKAWIDKNLPVRLEDIIHYDEP
jgi:hypothetical protein